MSLLSLFAIEFETNAKEAAADTDKLTDSLENTESAAEGATGATDSNTKAYNDNSIAIGSLTKSMVGIIASFVAFDAIATKVFENAASIDTIGKLSQTIGLNIIEMDAWGVAAERNGGSAEAFRGTVESLQNSLQDISITGGGEIINTLAMIGVQATKADGQIKSAFEILPEIADAFSRLSTEQSFAFGRRLGLDQGTILTLQQSRHEVDNLIERQKLLGGVTEDGYEAAAKFNDQWGDTGRVFNSLWLDANNSILPLLTKILKGMESIGLWVRDNQTLVTGFFIGVAGAITAVYLPAITAAATATLVAIAPFLLIGAAIVAVGAYVALLYEDILAWVNGSKSAIGEVVGSFEDLKNKITGAIDSVINKWNEFVTLFEETSDKIAGFFDSIDLSAGIELKGGYQGRGLNNFVTPSGNTEAAQAIISSYSATNLNQGGSTVSNRSQTNSFTFGDTHVNASGMSAGDAKRVFAQSNRENIEMAQGQLDDGVDR